MTWPTTAKRILPKRWVVRRLHDGQYLCKTFPSRKYTKNHRNALWWRDYSSAIAACNPEYERLEEVKP